VGAFGDVVAGLDGRHSGATGAFGLGGRGRQQDGPPCACGPHVSGGRMANAPEAGLSGTGPTRLVDRGGGVVLVGALASANA